MITDYIGGEGSAETPKNDYVIYGWPLISESVCQDILTEMTSLTQDADRAKFLPFANSQIPFLLFLQFYFLHTFLHFLPFAHHPFSLHPSFFAFVFWGNVCFVSHPVCWPPAQQQEENTLSTRIFRLAKFCTDHIGDNNWRRMKCRHTPLLMLKLLVWASYQNLREKRLEYLGKETVWRPRKG